MIDMRNTFATIMFSLPLLLISGAVAHADCTGSNCLASPLSQSLSSLPAFLSAAFTALVKISLPIITVFIVYSGFLFVTAQGNPGKLEIAKRNFFYAVLGALLILSAWVLATLIGNTLTQIVGS